MADLTSVGIVPLRTSSGKGFFSLLFCAMITLGTAPAFVVYFLTEGKNHYETRRH